LFYSTVWVSEVYNRSINNNGVSNTTIIVDSGSEEDKLGDSTRIGSLTLLIYSIVSMIASIVLPFMVNPSSSAEASSLSSTTTTTTTTSRKFVLPISWLTLPKLWTISHFIFG